MGFDRHGAKILDLLSLTLAAQGNSAGGAKKEEVDSQPLALSDNCVFDSIQNSPFDDFLF
jgi:hypothetical protein